MSGGPTRIDELIAKVLPGIRLPRHLKPSDLLDEAVEPPPRVAERVHALRALVRSGGRPETLYGRIASSRDVANFFTPRLAADLTESLWSLGCDAKNRVRTIHCVARGGASQCSVTPADILRPAIVNACSSAIIVHNHPSGDPSPSPEDIAMTGRVSSGCEVLGIRLLDHVIIGGEGYFSFLDAGFLSEPR